MRVAFLYNRFSEDPAQAAEDEVPARSPVVAAIKRLGHHVTPVECTLDLASLRRRLFRATPDIVFNRVDSLGGSDALMSAVTLLLDSMQIPYTGCPTAALIATADKVAVKQRLVRAGLPTPRWVVRDRKHPPAGSPVQNGGDSRFIVKAVYEHASFELSEASLFDATDIGRIAELLREREAESGRAHFAEQFIEGREFNLSLIGEGPRVLPPAEIDFSEFPTGKPHIVSHDAKCNYESFEYLHTDRRFDFPGHDEPLIRKLKTLAIECWRLLGLQGYARVDFRCDSSGQPWILEVNTNPCILPDAGFAAAWEQAGIDYHDGIRQILDDAVERHPMRAQRTQEAVTFIV